MLTQLDDERDHEDGAGPSEELIMYIKHKDLSDAKIAQLEQQVGPVHAQCLRAQQMLAAYAEEDARLAEEMRLRAERRQEVSVVPSMTLASVLSLSL